MRAAAAARGQATEATEEGAPVAVARVVEEEAAAARAEAALVATEWEAVAVLLVVQRLQAG